MYVCMYESIYLLRGQACLKRFDMSTAAAPGDAAQLKRKKGQGETKTYEPLIFVYFWKVCGRGVDRMRGGNPHPMTVQTIPLPPTPINIPFAFVSVVTRHTCMQRELSTQRHTFESVLTSQESRRLRTHTLSRLK